MSERAGAAFERLLRRPLGFAALVIAFVGVPVLVLGEVSADQSRALLRHQEIDSARASAVAAAASADGWLAAIRRDIAALAEVAEVKAAVAARDDGALGPALSAIAPHVGLHRGPGQPTPVRWMFVTDRSGVVLAEEANDSPPHVGRDLSTLEIFQRLRASGVTAAGAVLPQDVLAGPAAVVPVGRLVSPSVSVSVQPVPTAGVLLGARVRHGLDAFAGTVIFEPNVAQLELLLRPSLGDAEHLYLVDGNGVAIVHVPSDSAAKSRPLGQNLAAEQSVERAVSAGPESSSMLAGSRIFGWSMVGDTGWRVVVDGPAGVRQAAIDTDLASQRALRIGLVALLGLGAVLLSRTARGSLRRRDDLAESLDQQTAIAEILRAIAGSVGDEGPVLRTIAEAAVRFCAAEGATVVILEDGRARPVAHAGTIPLQTHAGAWHPGSIEPTDDIANSSNRARAVARLRREGQTIGVLVIQRTRPSRFTQHHVDLLRSFADQAVIAIENARLFKEIQTKSRELEAASRNKSEFLASMSHELRTPLNAIIGFNEIVKEGMAGPLTEKQHDYLQDALGSAHHLLSLINEILDLSKVEAGRMDLEIGDFSLGDLVHASIGVIRERAARHGIVVRAEAAGVDSVVGDERKIKQVLFNLLSNAVKFTPDGGSIDVRAWRVDKDWNVSVRDNGVGIPPEDRDRIFEEFLQSRSAGVRSHEGTGLGLALSKRFVELHGGRISVESEVGAGSTFTFSIPIRPERTGTSIDTEVTQAS